MAIKFKCSCGREMNVKDQMAGKKGKCPACGQVVQVPTLEDVAAATAAVAPPEPAAPAPAEAPVPSTPLGTSEPAGPTKACMHCRKQIPADAVFCTHCGTHLRSGKKAAEDHGGIEGDYDFLKVAPDLFSKPMQAVGTIVDATPSTDNFRKAIIFFLIGTAFFAFMVSKMDPETRWSVPLWVYGLTGLLAVVAAVTSGITASVAGTMFGQTGVGTANVFMAVLAVRAIIGLAMILPIIVMYAVGGFDTLPLWTARIIRIFAGGGLMYVVIYRAYDCGRPQAAVFAAISVVVEGLVFWLVQLILGWVLPATKLVLF